MRASDFIKERPKSVLTIFDIDDTLFHTTAKINVVKDGKVVRSLTNQEFNNYELQDGEEYDFGEFRNAEKFRQESEPIGPMLDELKTILDHTRGKVIMLTARADFDNKETFLQTFADHGIDMSKIHVHRAGNLPGKEGPAEKKAVWVRRYLDTGKFNQVSLYDDSMTNLRVFKELEQEYPDVKFYAHHITGHGEVNTLEERKKRKKKKTKYGAALWGPGPYGLYGWNTGYSGVSSATGPDGGGGDGGGGIGERYQINEAWTPDKKQRIKEFALWAIKLLDIKQSPRIKMVADSGTTALGYFDPETKEIVITYKDRHQMDIMRTLAHELVHRKQIEFRELDGSTGSDDENEANAIAGVLLRKWGKMNPEHFNEDIKQETNKLIPYPKGTVKVDVSDVYDWYKLGMNISDLDDADPKDFGKGPPQTVLSFGSEPLEHKYLQALKRLRLKTHDIDEDNQDNNVVTRIDSKPIKDFTTNLKAYKHTDDWSQSGLDTGDDSYWKKNNLKVNTTKGLYAGDPQRTALYATGNAHETRYVEFKLNGQPIVYFDKKDLPKIRSRRTYLTVFDASNFKKLPTGEYFSENPGEPLKQTEIKDPFQYIASQGWIIRITDNLEKVFDQVKNMHKAGKIPQYGAEGMNENMRLNEFAPVGSGGDKPPRGPKNKGRDPWDGNDGPGDDPYKYPEPEYYSRSIDFFGKFEADHFDDEEFDKETGVFKGYWDDEEGRIQIAYFKFDDPKQAAKDFDDSPGMGWYYEPQNESVGVSDESLNEFMPSGRDGSDSEDLHDILMNTIQDQYPKIIKKFGIDTVDSTVSSMIIMGTFDDIDPSNEEDLEDAVAEIYGVLEDNEISENFADGRNPEDKGDSKRHGIKKGMTIAQLKKIRSSKTASPRKKQLAHWQINMRQGKKK